MKSNKTVTLDFYEHERLLRELAEKTAILEKFESNPNFVFMNRFEIDKKDEYGYYRTHFIPELITNSPEMAKEFLQEKWDEFKEVFKNCMYQSDSHKRTYEDNINLRDIVEKREKEINRLNEDIYKLKSKKWYSR